MSMGTCKPNLGSKRPPLGALSLDRYESISHDLRINYAKPMNLSLRGLNNCLLISVYYHWYNKYKIQNMQRVKVIAKLNSIECKHKNYHEIIKIDFSLDYFDFRFLHYLAKVSIVYPGQDNLLYRYLLFCSGLSCSGEGGASDPIDASGDAGDEHVPGAPCQAHDAAPRAKLVILPHLTIWIPQTGGERSTIRVQGQRSKAEAVIEINLFPNETMRIVAHCLGVSNGGLACRGRFEVVLRLGLSVYDLITPVIGCRRVAHSSSREGGPGRAEIQARSEETGWALISKLDIPVGRWLRLSVREIQLVHCLRCVDAMKPGRNTGGERPVGSRKSGMIRPDRNQQGISSESPDSGVGQYSGRERGQCRPRYFVFMKIKQEFNYEIE